MNISKTVRASEKCSSMTTGYSHIGFFEFPEFSRVILKFFQTLSTTITPECERTYSTIPLSNNYSRPSHVKYVWHIITLMINKYYFINIKYKGFTFFNCGLLSGAQLGFWRGGGSILGPSTKRGTGGVTPGKNLKNVHAIWCIILHL